MVEVSSIDLGPLGFAALVSKFVVDRQLGAAVKMDKPALQPELAVPAPRFAFLAKRRCLRTAL